MTTIINPATGKPFNRVNPSPDIVRIRKDILRFLKAKYDAAQTTSQNEQHWAPSDLLSPDAANNKQVRARLRSRSRYEVSNNGYLKGIILSLCTDMVGSGPTLQITDSRFTKEQQEIIEILWRKRAKKVKLRQKLWQLRHAKAQDGEAIGLFFFERRRAFRDRTRINFRVIESDLVTNYEYPAFSSGRFDNEYDGVRFDEESGEAIEYHILNQHPGENLIFQPQPLKGTWYPAEQVIHWVRKDRPWVRGIPETTPTLPLWALLRRYTLAVVQNAEIAADFTVLLKSMQPAATTPFPLNGDGEPIEDNPDDWFSSFPVDRGLMTVLPSMYDLQQLDPKQPVTAYDAFVNALVQEAARPLLVPRNLAIGNSGDYNMASGTLDRQMYKANIANERYHCEEEVLDKDLENWWFEAIRIPGYFSDEGFTDNSIRDVVMRFQDLREDPPEHRYRWDELPEHVDPVKVAQAINILHMAGHISDIDIQEGRFNRRVEEHYENLRKQEEARREIFPEPEFVDPSTDTTDSQQDNLDVGE